MSSEQGKKPLADQIDVEVGSESRQLYEIIKEHQQKIIAAVAVVLVLVAGFTGFNAYQDHRLNRSEQYLDEALLEHHAAQRLTALESLHGSMPKPLQPRLWLETAKAAQELEDWEKALEFWQKLAKEGPEHWKLLGDLGLAAVLLRLDRPREALAELDRLAGKAPDQMQSLVLLTLAEAAELAGEWARALSAYEELKARGQATHDEYVDFKIASIRSRLTADES